MQWASWAHWLVSMALVPRGWILLVFTPSSPATKYGTGWRLGDEWHQWYSPPRSQSCTDKSASSGSSLQLCNTAKEWVWPSSHSPPGSTHVGNYLSIGVTGAKLCTQGLQRQKKIIKVNSTWLLFWVWFGNKIEKLSFEMVSLWERHKLEVQDRTAAGHLLHQDCIFRIKLLINRIFLWLQENSHFQGR